MQSRRDFLGTLLASFGALAIPTTQLWMPPKVTEGLPQLQPASITSLQQITKETLRRLINQMQLSRPLVLIPGEKIGESADGLTLNKQFTVEGDIPGEIKQFGLDPERYLTPVAASLAARLKHERVRGCGELQMPIAEYNTARCTHADSGLSLRAIQYWRHKELEVLRGGPWMYAPEELIPIIRFDVLVAA